MNRGAVAGLGGTEQEGIAKWAAVHEQLGPPPGGAGIAGPLDEALDLNWPDGVGDGNQRPGQVSAPHGGQALRRRLSRRNVEPELAIGVQLEADCRVGEGEGRHTSPAARVSEESGAEELPPRRGIEEQPADGDRGAALARRVGDLVQASTGDGDLGADPVRFGRGHREA